jgi:hypothetical protein
VNKLIQDWISFTTDFNAEDPSPASYTLPTVDPSQKDALIAVYKAAKQDRYQKQLDKTAADAALAAAQADFTYKQGLLTDVGALADGAASVHTTFVTTSSSFDTLKAAGDTFYAAASCASSGDKSTFLAALNTATIEASAHTSYVADAASLAGDVDSFETDRIADRDAASTAVTTATADQVTKAQLVTSALATEATALAAVYAVCPDFDPTSIPYVDG